MSAYTELKKHVLAIGYSIDGCIPWQLSTSRGYGQVRVGNKMCKVHQVAYKLMNGEPPEGHVIRHTCDNPICYNPNHLISESPLDK